MPIVTALARKKKIQDGHRLFAKKLISDTTNG